jgi:hypothetical protein
MSREKQKENDMTRYIDAELAKEALTGWETDPLDEEIERAIDNIPTANVAPKTEVAREIFEEIEPVFMSFCTSLEAYTAWKKLKNKYTEGQT